MISLVSENYFSTYISKLEHRDNPQAKIEFTNNHSSSSMAISSLFEPDKRDITEIRSNTCYIYVTGVLSPTLSLFDRWIYDNFCTAYTDIIDAIKNANDNYSVDNIVMVFKTPGGNVEYVEETCEAINNSSKKITAYVDSYALSAGYYLASQCHSITVSSRNCSVGSIGVITQIYNNQRMLEGAGIDRAIVTTAPYKHILPDDEGVSKIKESLDVVHENFVNRVVSGRKKAGIKATADVVNSSWGQGREVIAEKALSLGMIDKIEIQLNNKNSNKGDKKMSLSLQDMLASAEMQEHIKKEKEKAHADGKSEAVADMKTRHEYGAKILNSDAYTQATKNIAMQFVAGDISKDVFDLSVAYADQMNEQFKSHQAQQEQQAQAETPFNPHVVGNQVGVALASTPEELKNQIALFKSQAGGVK